ncbi:pilus assembly protein [Sphingomonas sp. KRR8]|uniref:TadE/TadG family type IV pilus assembly protein n=1 Tax=Sphingomonas sp. KRR8 TaxID=2942996 RepID=UPI00202034F3|nr:TadE/TadG family type IV pilus assembly protein [Sphingomonas sp. KRR8]URD62187.1 pilus assembly protein [Sphingomonas sp. KRR8]
MSGFFSRVRHSEQGTAVLELGLAIPLVFVLLLGMIDVGKGFSMKLQLEQVAQRSVEKVMNGQADRSQLDAIKNEAAAAAGVSTSAVTTSAWLECSPTNGGTPTYNYYPNDSGPCANGQVSRRYLRVTINKSFTPMFAVGWAGVDANGNYNLTGATSVRTQ